MNTPRLHRVQAASVRTALVATAIVAVVYASVAVAVVLIVTRDLTGEIDTRLTSALDRIATDQRIGDRPFRTPTEGPRFGPPLLVWVVAADGTVTGNDPNAALPRDEAATATAPHTVSIGGTDVRITGRAAAGGRVVVGQSTDSVSRARATVVLAEVIVGPLLLAAVFLGAFAIGRRVAAPIELARLRQMEFTADASHELRTPLAVIEAQSSLALAQPREASWYRTAFERVDHESRRIRRLVDDMLWLARFDASARTPGAEPVDLAVLAAQAADRFTVVAEARGLTLRVRSEPGTLVVAAPPDWLDRLLGALLDNACKYSPDGGTVEVSVRPDGARVRLGVDDSGPGIPPDQRTRIFDRFHRATSEVGGAGLGLAIADAIVRATSGRWEVGDSPLGGASMAVSWPRGLPAARNAVPAGPPPAASPHRART